MAILLHWNTHPGIVTRNYVVVNREISKIQEQDEWTIDFFPNPETIIDFGEDDKEEERKEGLIQKKVRTEFYRLKCKVTKIK